MYTPANLEEIKKRLANKGSSGGSGNDGGNKFNFYKFPSGTERVVVRYLPSASGVPGKLVKKHYNLPEIKDIICFRTHDMDCDLCNMLRTFENRMDVSDWASSTRSYMNALIVEDPTQKIDPRVPHIIGQGEGNLYWVYEKMADPDIGDVTDPNKGFNIAYKRTEFNGKFDRTVLPKQQPIAPTPAEVEVILGKMTDLDKIWRKPDDVFLKKLQDVTQKLQVVIESRLLTLVNQPPPPQAGTNPLDPEKPATPPPVIPAAAAPPSNRPANSPACFSDAKVFYKNEETGADDPDKQKCVSCAFDFHCGEEIKKRKT